MKNIAKDELPRERLLKNGPSSLSVRELLAILITSGTPKMNVMEVAQKILLDNDENLKKLARLTVDELKQYEGIGEAKAIAIVAALEIARRYADEKIIYNAPITGSNDIFQQLPSSLRDKVKEFFYVIYLNRSNRIIKVEKISEGGIDSTVVDVRLILKQALLNNATSIILAHNHPSGNLKPSSSDIDLTRKISKGADTMNIRVLDHLIVTDNQYYSFMDMGIMP